MNQKAILFGIDYSYSTGVYEKQNSCINDIYSMKNLLESKLNFKNIEVFSDFNNDKEVNGRYVIEKLSSIMAESKIQKWDTLWIHFCGCVCIDYQMDGCFLPRDFETFGTISQETFKLIFQTLFNDTKLICIFDCCQLKPFNDFEFQYVFEQDKMVIEKYYKFDTILSKKNIIIIANYDDLQHMNGCSGAMTKFILSIYNKNINYCLIDVLLRLKRLLKKHNYSCIPTLSSSIQITNTDKLCKSKYI